MSHSMGENPSKTLAEVVLSDRPDATFCGGRSTTGLSTKALRADRRSRANILCLWQSSTACYPAMPGNYLHIDFASRCRQVERSIHISKISVRREQLQISILRDSKDNDSRVDLTQPRG